MPIKSIARKTKTVTASASVLAVLLLLLVFFILPEASIKVTARTEAVTRDFEIRVDKNASEADFAALTVPGKQIEQEVEEEKAYPSTGVKNIGRKASGFVYLYNFSKTTLILKAQSTVLTVGDRKYYFTQDVGGIRPTALIGLEEQEVDPTSLIAAVPVAAAEPGEKYNLAKGARLEVENQVFGKQPKSLYAIVAEDVSGGSTKELKYAQSADIENAYTALAAELVEKEIANFGTSASVSSAVLEKSSQTQTGAEVPEFKVKVKVKLTGLSFDNDDIQKIITKRIERLLPENKSLRAGDGTRTTSRFISIDAAAGTAVVASHFESEIVYKIDTEELAERARGKTADEIKEIFLSRPGIASVEVKLYPGWAKRTPRLASKIYLKVQN